MRSTHSTNDSPNHQFFKESKAWMPSCGGSMNHVSFPSCVISSCTTIYSMHYFLLGSNSSKSNPTMDRGVIHPL